VGVSHCYTWPPAVATFEAQTLAMVNIYMWAEDITFPSQRQNKKTVTPSYTFSPTKILNTVLSRKGYVPPSNQHT